MRDWQAWRDHDADARADNAAAADDEHADWVAAGRPEPDDETEEGEAEMVTTGAMVSTATVELARVAVRDIERELRLVVLGSAATLHSTLEANRDALARQLAEDATGVSFADATLTALYARSQLSDRQIERAARYRAALARIRAELPSDAPGLLNACLELTGVRRPARAA